MKTTPRGWKGDYREELDLLEKSQLAETASAGMGGRGNPERFRVAIRTGKITRGLTLPNCGESGGDKSGSCGKLL